MSEIRVAEQRVKDKAETDLALSAMEAEVGVSDGCKKVLCEWGGPGVAYQSCGSSARGVAR